MAKVRNTKTENSQLRKIRPALSPEARENQMISFAVDLAEKQLREGTASSQVITHYIKLGSSRERLEREKLEEENKLLKAKTKAMESSEEIKALYKEAISAFRDYAGQNDGDDDEEEDYDY